MGRREAKKKTGDQEDGVQLKNQDYGEKKVMTRGEIMERENGRKRSNRELKKWEEECPKF